MDSPEQKLTIRFTGRKADAHKVPASVMNQVLMGLQRAIHLLAMQHQEIEVRQKERISSELEDKYVLLCEAPQPGSFMIQAALGDPTSDLFASDDISEVAKSLEAFSLAAQDQDLSRIRKIMPDTGRRKRLIEAFGKMVPRSGTGIHVQVGWNGKPFLNSQRLHQSLREMPPSSASEEEIQIVTGKLIRIDFDVRKVTILYKPSERQLECYYDESVEEMLLERPRELIQVSGVMRLDEKGVPEKIVDVEKIRELDLSRFYFEKFQFQDFVLVFNPPLVLEPELIENEQLLLLREESLGIDVIAPTIDELEESLREEIIMLWINFAKEKDENLSPKALELKTNLLSRIAEERGDG